jgi:hypothetical protein
MTYESIEALQGALARDVFVRAKDAKKAAGRALGTIVETLTFFVLESWGLRDGLAIEQKLPEFGNGEITHNVEFSLHPRIDKTTINLRPDQLASSLSAKKLLKDFQDARDICSGLTVGTTTILDKSFVQRNCCVIAKSTDGKQFVTAQLLGLGNQPVLHLNRLVSPPYAMFECKRVGVEEGQKRGPTTIEKAKQGAYVASRVSSLQRIFSHDGSHLAVVFEADGSAKISPYKETLDWVISNGSIRDLEGVVATVGIVSNHGNWFTGTNLNKELKVLRQSYDWLLFLKDNALAEFITDAIFNPAIGMECVREAFLATYETMEKGRRNTFTKVTMSPTVYSAMLDYMVQRKEHIAKDWFEVLAPFGSSLFELQNELITLDSRVQELYSERR